jgi:hypothetical protein
MPLRLLTACALLVSACDAPAPTDAGADAPVTDVPALPDTPDAPAPTALCRPCRRDIDCGDGAFCSVFPDGAWACVTACFDDLDCEGTPLPTTCAAEADGLPLGCRPTAGSCVVSDPGSACTGACSGTYDVCAEPEPGLGRYCTTACETDADCPLGLRRCADSGAGRLCVRDEAAPAERCAALAAALPACGAGRSCAAGSSCVGTSTPRCLPIPSPTCPAGTVEATASTGPVCVPHVEPNIAAPDGALLPDCACLLEDGGLFDEVATLAGRSRCELMFPHALLDLFPTELSHDELRLSWTDRVHSDWLAPPRFASAIGTALDSASTDEVVVILSGLADRPAAPAAPPTSEASAALAALITAAGGPADMAAITAAVGGVTGPRGAALGAFFASLERALTAREEALSTYVAAERRFLYDAPSALFLPSVAVITPARDLLGAMRGDVDVGRMASASAELLAAIDAVAAAFAAGGTAGLAPLSVATPAGSVVIGSSAVDTHEGAAYLLVLEPGGDDVYRAPVGATASADNGVSVLVDLGGADDYGYREVPVASDVGPSGHTRLPSDGAGRAPASSTYGPYTLSRASRQGAGRLGIGILVDAGSDDDHYRSLRMSQGYGALGVGVLVDRGGSDTYDGEAGVQGSAVAGIGLLVDEDGIDHYGSYHASQGFAYVRGVGVLLDRAGDDEYFANPGDVLYYSPQSPGVSNSSFCQGVGFGRRDDSGGLYMSGGLGVLRDAAGGDRYTCGIFGQATGYWYGTGLLLEGAGDDHYDGRWYVQAGDAHFAIAVLLDAAGNDVHNETAMRMNAAVAGGHDFSQGWLIDRLGDDVYYAPNLSFGVGHAGGFGAFVDMDGTDTYEAASDLSFGNASIETPGDPTRRMSGTVGVFLDRGGTDTYTRPTAAPVANDATWTQSLRMGESENGAGIDRATGMLGAGLD